MMIQAFNMSLEIVHMLITMWINHVKKHFHTLTCGLVADPDGFPAGPFCFTGVLLDFLAKNTGFWERKQHKPIIHKLRHQQDILYIFI